MQRILCIYIKLSEDVVVMDTTTKSKILLNRYVDGKGLDGYGLNALLSFL